MFHRRDTLLTSQVMVVQLSPGSILLSPLARTRDLRKSGYSLTSQSEQIGQHTSPVRGSWHATRGQSLARVSMVPSARQKHVSQPQGKDSPALYLWPSYVQSTRRSGVGHCLQHWSRPKNWTFSGQRSCGQDTRAQRTLPVRHSHLTHVSLGSVKFWPSA